MKAVGASVPPETLIALYGRPKPSQLRKRSTPGLYSASNVDLSPSHDDENAPLQRCSSAPAGSSAIVFLGPRSRNITDGCSLPSHPTLGSPQSLPPSCKGNSDHRNFSLADIKRIVHKPKPLQVNSLCGNLVDPVDANLDAHQHFCAACAKGYCISNSFPHGPDGYTDRGRMRVGPRPSSQPAAPSSPPAVASEGCLRPNTADVTADVSDIRKAKIRRGRASSARASSLEKWSNDGSCSYDVYDYVEIDPDDAVGKSPLGGTWLSRSHKKHDEKSKNPFVEFETREQRLMQERKWLLEEDGLYMHEQKKDLKHNKTQNRINLGWRKAPELYECRILYGPYAMDMKEQKHGKRRLIKPKTESTGRATATRKRANANKRGDLVEISADPSSLEIKGCQRKLEASMQQRGYVSPEDAQKKEAKKSADASNTFDSFKLAFKVSSDTSKAQEQALIL